MKSIKMKKSTRLASIDLKKLENSTDLSGNGSISLGRKKGKTEFPLEFPKCLLSYVKTLCEPVVPFKCPLCWEGFELSTQLQDHLGETHEFNDYRQSTECAVCPQKFRKGSTLVLCNGCVDDFARTRPVSIIHQCGRCNVCFVGKNDLKEHVRAEHSQETKKVEMKKRLLVHETIREDLPSDEDTEEVENVDQRECPSEQEMDNSRQSLDDSLNEQEIMHKRRKVANRKKSQIHTGEKPFICNYCNKKFSHQNALRRHERTHTGEQPYICKFCKKCFSDCSSLKRHERIHTGEKPHVCRFCKKGFSQFSNLQRHERIHTGEKPFVCKFCKKDFSDSSSLRRHKKTQHNGEK